MPWLTAQTGVYICPLKICGMLHPQTPAATTFRAVRRRETPSCVSGYVLHMGLLGSARPTGEFLHRLLFVLVLLAHDRRLIRHVAVTAHPTTAAWTAHQLREAFPWDQAPRYVIHDHAFDGLGATAQAMGIEGMLTAGTSCGRR